MEQPCYKCGQPVEQGIPFCPHCSAPQIRVVIAEPASGPSASVDSPETPLSASGHAPPPPIPRLDLPWRWSQAIKPCALAALVASLLMSLGLNPFVAMLSVGFLAVVFYRQRRRGITIKASVGAALGALSGLLWFAISSVIEALIVISLHKGPELRSQMLEKIQQASAQTSDPQVLAMFDRLKTPDGLKALIIFGIVFAFLAAIVLAGLGGALGGAIFGRRDQP